MRFHFVRHALGPLLVAGGLLPAVTSAAILNYDITFSVTGDAAVTGSNPFTGTFGYDDTTGVVGFGGETVYALTSFALNFLDGGLGATFLLGSDAGTPTATVSWDNIFVGITYSGSVGTDLLQISAGNAGLSPIVPGDASVGSVSYSLDNGTYSGTHVSAPLYAQRAPEPSAGVASLALVAIAGLAARRRRQRPLPR